MFVFYYDQPSGQNFSNYYMLLTFFSRMLSGCHCPSAIGQVFHLCDKKIIKKDTIKLHPLIGRYILAAKLAGVLQISPCILELALQWVTWTWSAELCNDCGHVPVDSKCCVITHEEQLDIHGTITRRGKG